MQTFFDNVLRKSCEINFPMPGIEHKTSESEADAVSPQPLGRPNSSALIAGLVLSLAQ